MLLQVGPWQRKAVILRHRDNRRKEASMFVTGYTGCPTYEALLFYGQNPRSHPQIYGKGKDGQ